MGRAVFRIFLYGPLQSYTVGGGGGGATKKNLKRRIKNLLKCILLRLYGPDNVLRGEAEVHTPYFLSLDMAFKWGYDTAMFNS